MTTLRDIVCAQKGFPFQQNVPLQIPQMFWQVLNHPR